MAWTIEIGRRLRGKPKVFTEVFGLRAPSIADVIAGAPFATELAKRGCDEYVIVDGRGKPRARVWMRPDGRYGVVQDPDPGAPIERVGRMTRGGPRTLGWVRAGTFHSSTGSKPDPALATALKAVVRLAEKGGAPTPTPKLKARWTRRVPRDLAKLTALDRTQLAAAARGLGAKSVAALLAHLEKADVDLERVALTGTSALVGWVSGREDGVFFDAEAARPNGITMSQGEVHDEKADRADLVRAVQRAVAAACR